MDQPIISSPSLRDYQDYECDHGMAYVEILFVCELSVLFFLFFFFI